MTQVGFKRTGRKCTESGCKGRLKDFILDWEDALPEDELTASEQAASAADLAICLGTSLQITPACDLPLLTVKTGRTQSQPSACAAHGSCVVANLCRNSEAAVILYETSLKLCGNDGQAAA